MNAYRRDRLEKVLSRLDERTAVELEELLSAFRDGYMAMKEEEQAGHG